MKYYTKDAIVQFAHEPQLQGTDALVKSYRDWFEDTTMRLKSFTSSSVDSHNITVAASGDLAYDYGTNKMIYASP
jgi:ketosteroid isomerase-like protein